MVQTKSFYFIVFTKLGPTTERKCRKAEKNASDFPPIKRHIDAERTPKDLKPIIWRDGRMEGWRGCFSIYINNYLH